MTNSERASYIRGLMDGLELDPNAKETKVLNAIVELLDDLCLSVEELEDGFAELSEQVDEIDEDLGNVEEDFYELEGGCSCHHHGNIDDFDGAEFEVTCPSCGIPLSLQTICWKREALSAPAAAKPWSSTLTKMRVKTAAAVAAITTETASKKTDG